MNRRKIIEKIIKCLALSKSANRHEAALAMARAQEMMEKYSISKTDVELAEISSRKAKACQCLNPPCYIAGLVNMIKDAFGCRAIMHPYVGRNWKYANNVEFVGAGPNPEIAAYAFEVLQKQLVRGRTKFMKSLSRRIKRRNKTSMADNWAEGWVIGVSRKVKQLVVTTEERGLIEKWIEENYNAIEPSQGRKADRCGRRGVEALMQGMVDSKDVNLHGAVNGHSQEQYYIEGVAL